ncbi:beta-glucosidase [Grosmannia clavigera kw1407]|uniref:Probable beta-glucosidase I n=1 Tax=Grosmannia clavigera (strain kw1407 / UAMH 11150) TaxID=655863 RepID=F0X9Q9_GROCL|nr:beta-glucosidase [Grosmannia clavigera kw1407]EFX05617.1 beta-glucosidase [Grosmannia clavigera kw1407]
MADIDIDDVLAKLSVPEKVALTSGIDFWHTVSVPRLGVPSIRMSDGPNGVRGTRLFNGIRSSCLPSAVALGASWDVELMEDLGQLLGREAKAKGAHVLLGPTINIQRSPLGGRGFESFSEDAVLSGNLAGHYCKGIRSEKIIPTLKHFVCNDQEHERKAVNVIVTDRALREVYLLPFQISLKLSGAEAIMTSYNKVGGIHVSEHKELIDGILRKDWGWDGTVISDCVSEAINAGLDLEMPGPSRFRQNALTACVSSNKVLPMVLDERVRNVLKLIKRAAGSRIPEHAPMRELNSPEDRDLLRRAVAESVVLLKNEKSILPLDPKRSVAVIGPNAKAAFTCGGGSAWLPGYHSISPLEGITSKVQRDSKVQFSQGITSFKKLPQLGPHLTTPKGEVGFIFRAYNEPPSVNSRQVVDELHLEASKAILFDYTPPGLHPTTFYAEAEGTFTPTESGMYDFGVTVAGTGQLFIDQELVVDNETVQNAGNSFFGMGTVEELGSKVLEAGVPYTVLFRFGSAPLSKVTNPKVVSFGKGGFSFGASRRVETEQAIADAVSLAGSAEQVVLVVGLNGEWESEGFDRPNMDLPPHTDRLVSAVLAANPDIVVVVQSGSPVSMPWVDDAATILQAWYSGDEGGHGLADVLFGDVNPSGALPFTYPRRVQDNPAYINFLSESGRVLYGEDVYVGYRYYDKVDRPTLFPFGHGLSYTTFLTSELEVALFEEEPTRLGSDEKVRVTLNLTNIGDRAGAVVIQIYIVPARETVRNGKVDRPIKELKGFSKSFLDPGQTKNIVVDIPTRLATSWWNEQRNQWHSQAGVYEVWAVTSAGHPKIT